MRRRALVTGAFLATLSAWNGGSRAQDTRPVIAFLAHGSQYRDSFVRGMQDRGHVKDRDYVLEERYSKGDANLLRMFADELVSLGPKAIVTGSSAAAVTTREATDSIPIVAATIGDPVGLRLTTREARPERNVTGIRVMLDGLAAKQLEIALDLVPNARVLGVLSSVENPTHPPLGREVASAAASRGISLLTENIESDDQIKTAFDRFRRDHAEAVIVLSDSRFIYARAQVARIAVETGFPTIFGIREQVEAGGLISYGVNQGQSFRRAAYYVHRILNGEKPADLPVEFPTTLELVLNLRTARALTLTIPPTLLARADEVI